MTMICESPAPAPEAKKAGWTTSAGPRQTKAVKEAMSKLTGRGRSVRQLWGVKGVDEHESTMMAIFGPTSAACNAALEEIGERFEWTITRDNCREVEAAFLEAARTLEIPVKDERRTPEEANEQAARLREADAKREEEGRRHAAEVAWIEVELRKEYPWAIGEGKLSRHARAAANLREELSRTWPGVKFTVRSESFSGGDAVNVGWLLGPTYAEVVKVADKYKYGSFDGMDDSYNDDRSAGSAAVGKVLGQAKYVHCSRGFGDDVWELLERGLCELQGVEFKGHRTEHVFGENDGQDVQRHISVILSDTVFPAGAVVTGIECSPWDEENPPKHCHRVTFTVDESQAAAVAPVAGEGGEVSGGYRIEKHRHTKKGFDMFMVILVAKVDRPKFESLRRSCERADGWYSRQWGRTPGGFAFKEEAKASEWAKVELVG